MQGIFKALKEYFSMRSGGFLYYLVEESLKLLVGYIPTVIGIALRSIGYRVMIKGSGWFAIENNVEISGMRYITIGRGVYIGRGAWLQGRPGGLLIGDGTRIMNNAILNVYNFRALTNSGIIIGKECVIGINSIITGQGGVKIGDKVIIAPSVMILAVNHIFENPTLPIKDQGIKAMGIEIKDGAWIGAGSIILDGVKIGKNAVVAAGSLVREDVPDFSLVAGNPARVIKQGKGEIIV